MKKRLTFWGTIVLVSLGVCALIIVFNFINIPILSDNNIWGKIL